MICLTEGANYSDAIALAERISQEEGFICEGGVRNIGRRDGMATAMLNAVETIGHIPDYYFQAIGSGAGAIAAHEAAKRLVEDSRFGQTLPRLMLSQNAPFTPICNSWQTGRRELAPMKPDVARIATERIVATVLSNQCPPYSVAGGIFDALSESRGSTFAVTNDDARTAMALFEKCEGIDIEPAAGVALASLCKAAQSAQVSPGATTLLHITGGGALRLALERTLYHAKPDLEISLAELGKSNALGRACALFDRTIVPTYPKVAEGYCSPTALSQLRNVIALSNDEKCTVSGFLR